MPSGPVTSVAPCLRRLFCRSRVEGASRYGEDFASLFSGQACRDERPRALGCLDHHHTEGDARYQPVPARKVFRARRIAGRSFADEQSSFADRRLQVRVLRRVDNVDAARHDRNRAAVEARRARGTSPD
jgi:hypothetical protein